MRKILSFMLLLLCCPAFFCGCSSSRQVENQAYVIVMGVDAAENGGIELTAKIPVLSAGGDEPSSGDSYRHFSSLGENYHTSLKNLHAASPRNLNLAQLELLVISKDLAEKDNFHALIEDIAQTERLYTASNIVIYEGNAGEFVKALEPAVGSRLSLDIPAIFENYTDQGLIPESRLADLYYLSETVYSDPMVALAALNNDQDPTVPVGENIESYSKTSYLGSMIFSAGEAKLELSADETTLANLLRNEVKYFRYEVDGRVIEAAPYAPTGISVDLTQTPASLSVKLRLNIGTQEDMPSENRIKEKITEDVRNLIVKSQQHGAEPFGFANSAASKFATMANWREFDWDNAYKNADIDISVSLSRWDA